MYASVRWYLLLRPTMHVVPHLGDLGLLDAAFLHSMASAKVFIEAPACRVDVDLQEMMFSFNVAAHVCTWVWSS